MCICDRYMFVCLEFMTIGHMLSAFVPFAYLIIVHNFAKLFCSGFSVVLLFLSSKPPLLFPLLPFLALRLHLGSKCLATLP